MKIKAFIIKILKMPMRNDKMQLTTKNGLNRMKNTGVMAGYVKYAKSVFWQYGQK